MIKSIYTMTLDDEYPSVEDINKFRMIVEFVYEDLASGLYDTDDCVLVTNSELKRNRYYEDSVGNSKFESNNIYYEPTLFKDNICGITLVDSLMTPDKFKDIVDNVMRLLHVDFKVKIDKFSYNATNIQDESMRRRAILLKMVVNKFNKMKENNRTNTKSLVRRPAIIKR